MAGLPMFIEKTLSKTGKCSLFSNVLKLIGLFIFLYIQVDTSFAQKRNNVWAFGEHAGINFNTNPPVALDSTAIADKGDNQFVYGSSICDKDGKLLFYTNGWIVWDSKNKVIEKYEKRWPWTLHVVPLICPYPGNDSLFYLFGVSNGKYAYKLQYLTLNKNGNGGKGEIVYPKPSTLSNYFTVLQENTSLYLAGTAHCNRHDTWIVTHADNAFYSYLVTDNGVSTTPVVSPISPDVMPGGQYDDKNMKFSASGEKLIIPFIQKNKTLVFDFNNQTGTISSGIALPLPEKKFLDDAEISPDGTKLYVAWYEGNGSYDGELHNVSQLNLNAGTIDKVLQSSFVLNKFPDRGNFCSPHFCVYINRTMELGPDGRIYISMLERTDQKLDLTASLIEDPNELREAAWYTKNSFKLKRKYQYIKYNYIRSSVFTVKENGIQYKKKVCINSPVNFSLLISKIDSVKWDFGDLPSGNANFSTSLAPSHTYPAPGTYHVSAIIYTRCFIDTAYAEVTISEEPAIHVPESLKDSTVCIGKTLLADATTPTAIKYEWENGFNRPVRELEKSGTYKVMVVNECSFDSRSFVVSFDACDCKVFVPNAFTPNRDQLNDIFRPVVKCPGIVPGSDVYTFKIFNRYGQNVYSTNNKGEGWNGSLHNEPSPSGVYSWLVQFTNPNTKKTVTESGSFTLIR